MGVGRGGDAPTSTTAGVVTEEEDPPKRRGRGRAARKGFGDESASETRPWSSVFTEMLIKAHAASSFATGVPDVSRAISGGMAPALAIATLLSSGT